MRGRNRFAERFALSLAPRRPDGNAGRLSRRRKARAQRIFGIHHRRAEPGPAEKDFLRIRIGFHGVVVVEMVAREVREDPDAKVRARKPPLLEADRARLNGEGLRAITREPCVKAFERHGIGRRQVRRRDLPAVEEDPHRADYGSRGAQLRKELAEPERARRLPVRAGDGNARHLLRGVAVKERGDLAEARGKVRDRERRHRIVFAPRRSVRLVNHAGGAAGCRHADEGAAVRLRAGNGAEDVARAHFAAVELHFRPFMHELMHPVDDFPVGSGHICRSSFFNSLFSSFNSVCG